MFHWLKRLFGLEKENEIEEDSMKFLIVGLGNTGPKYDNTRHNVGFEVVDAIAEKKGATFERQTLADVATIKHRGRTIILIKPTTFMNLSGKAVNYWMDKHKIAKNNVLVVLDDLNLDFGVLRMRGKGSDGGHNGLKDIDIHLQGNNYARLRVGIGNKYHKGQQVDYVLGTWSSEEKKHLPQIITFASDAAVSFASIGLKFTMGKFNRPLDLKES